jgi:predicted dehydrogenase
MALSRSDVEKVVAAAGASPKATYAISEEYCFLSGVLYAAHLTSSGKIGPVVYCESEYIHDVTFRFREGPGGPDVPRVDSWYAEFDPLMYAHSIGPAMVGMGGLKTPAVFTEVWSYANSIGDDPDRPICKPASSFQVALFKTAAGAVCKVAGGYVYAREPPRRVFLLTGRYGSFELNSPGGAGRLFLADGFAVSRWKQRAGSVKRVGWCERDKVAGFEIGGHWGGNVRLKRDWVASIAASRQPALHASVAANMCIAGICAVEAAKAGKPVQVPSFT